jgi:hypothetical protein
MKNFERPIGERDLIKPLGLHPIGRNRPGFGVYIDFVPFRAKGFARTGRGQD